MKRLVIALFFTGMVFGESPLQPPTVLITAPTAGLLKKGSYSADFRIQREGGILFGLDVGITTRFMFGVSFGASQFLGSDSVRWNPRPEVNLKYLLIDETNAIPALSLGLDTQGFGEYNSDDSLRRYETKAYGAFLSLSKNWKTPLGNAGLHAGTNYNFIEESDGDKDVSLYFGADIELNQEVALLLEYNAALNENDMAAKDISLNRGGYLNSAIRWTFVNALYLELELNNLLFDKKNVESFNREIKITFIEAF